MRSRTVAFFLLCSGVLFIAGCGGGERAMEEAATQEQAPAQAAPAAAPQLPDTTAAALWGYLTRVDYRNNWKLWPATAKLYQGREPHGALLTTYVNQIAHDAVTGKTGSMAANAIIVKENFMPDSMLAAVTVMYKVAGFDPGNNNWYWAKYGPDGAVEVQGRGQGCIACHVAQKANDYVFTGSLRP